MIYYFVQVNTFIYYGLFTSVQLTKLRILGMSYLVGTVVKDTFLFVSRWRYRYFEKNISIYRYIYVFVSNWDTGNLDAKIF